MFRKTTVLIVIAVCILSISCGVLADDSSKTDEEIIAGHDWKVVASWEVDSNGNVVEDGLVVNDKPEVIDGRFEIVEKDGAYGASMIPAEGHHCHLYFKVDDNILFDLAPGNVVMITMEFLDEGMLAPMQVHYDSNILDAAGNGVWAGIRLPERLGSGKWKTVTGLLREAKFSNRQNHGSDFRLWGEWSPYTVKKITLAVIK